MELVHRQVDDSTALAGQHLGIATIKINRYPRAAVP
ncbi:hypothetical protein [Sporisorium scitamineum]|uniref:Uncharacterized protein n=1 Tax=Sporisorium scitamineum TaxID=49012 RepID=A0A0F7SBN4_9BASI|nr:hypothetical protein [Sporisorium scitamineum]